MAITCYNLVVNSITGLYEKHGEVIFPITSATQLCTSVHYLVTDSVINADLNTSADNSVVSANNNINNNVISATSASMEDPQIDTLLNDEIVNMKVIIQIVVYQPIIRTVYNPLTRTKPEDVVKKN